MLRKKIERGVLLIGVSRYSNIIIGIFSTSILARIISPNEFGFYAFGMIIFTFLQSCGDFGIRPLIIQNNDLKKEDLESILIFTLIIGIFYFLIIQILAFYVQSFYDIRNFSFAVNTLSLNAILLSLNILPESLLYKKQLFKKIAFFNIFSAFFSSVIGIILALKGYGFKALFVKLTLDVFLVFLLNYITSPIKLVFKLKKLTIIKIYTSSSSQFFFNILNYFSKNIDNILISKYLGLTQLAYYDRSYKLNLLPLESINSILSPVIHPVLSEISNDEDRIFIIFNKLTDILAHICFPISVFLYFSSREVVYLFFGFNWESSIVIFKILSLSIGFQILSSSTNSFFQILNKSKLLFYSSIFNLISILIGVIIGIIFGSLYVVSLGLLIAFIFNNFIKNYILYKIIFKRSFNLFTKKIAVSIFPSLILSFLFSISSHISISSLINSFLLKIGIFLIFFIISTICIRAYRVYIIFILKKISFFKILFTCLIFYLQFGLKISIVQ
jgi:teichuronic acid exporter